MCEQIDELEIFLDSFEGNNIKPYDSDVSSLFFKHGFIGDLQVFSKLPIFPHDQMHLKKRMVELSTLSQRKVFNSNEEFEEFVSKKCREKKKIINNSLLFVDQEPAAASSKTFGMQLKARISNSRLATLMGKKSKGVSSRADHHMLSREIIICQVAYSKNSGRHEIDQFKGLSEQLLEGILYLKFFSEARQLIKQFGTEYIYGDFETFDIEIKKVRVISNQLTDYNDLYKLGTESLNKNSCQETKIKTCGQVLIECSPVETINISGVYKRVNDIRIDLTSLIKRNLTKSKYRNWEKSAQSLFWTNLGYFERCIEIVKIDTVSVRELQYRLSDDLNLSDEKFNVVRPKVWEFWCQNMQFPKSLDNDHLEKLEEKENLSYILNKFSHNDKIKNIYQTLVTLYMPILRSLAEFPDTLIYVKKPLLVNEILKKFKKIVIFIFSHNILFKNSLTHQKDNFKHFLQYLNANNMNQNQDKMIGLILDYKLHSQIVKNLDFVNQNAYDQATQVVLYNDEAQKSFKNQKIITLNGLQMSKIYKNELDLSGNWLIHLDKFSFNQLDPSFEIDLLDLRNNLIQHIESRSFGRFFYLTSLNLSGNFIDRIANETFTELKNLEMLCLSRNLIFRIEEYAFENLINLKILDLSYNRLRNLEFNEMNSSCENNLGYQNNEIDIFRNLTKLESLNLSHNFLRELSPSPKNCFLMSQQNLVDLNLSHNRLVNLPGSTFGSLDGLECLDLSYNYLTLIEKKDRNLFASMGNLQILFLNNNRFVLLDEFFFSNLTKLKYLLLHQNRIDFIHPDTFYGMIGSGLNYKQLMNRTKNESKLTYKSKKLRASLKAVTLYGNPILSSSRFNSKTLADPDFFKKSTQLKCLILEKDDLQVKILRSKINNKKKVFFLY